jgi:2-dehydro-3-deoxyphosphogluconate aldolase/(4S)-4-hydroxy-2-oxoglutarate aldolase
VFGPRSSTPAIVTMPVFGCFSDGDLTAWNPAPSSGLSGDRARTGILQDVRGPPPNVKLMPTGGVSIENAGDWIRARRGGAPGH